jgi:S-(hydroxymethyl)glutathione dehydrogenase/alcohol dehydrogenase
MCKANPSAIAAILVESRSNLVVEEILLPPGLKYGQVLVQVHYSGICASQVHEIDATKGPDRFLPHLLGHEGSATVLAVGDGVTSVNTGDNVVMHWKPGRGIQSANPSYRWGDLAINAGSVTTFNSHAVVSENRITRIPADFDLRLAPLFGCAITTAFGVVGNDAKVKIGESVVVFGAGGVGLAAIQAANMTSAFPIIAVDLVGEKLAAALAIGATHAIDSNRVSNVGDLIYDIVGSEGADVVIETTGVVEVIETAYNVSSARGRTILVGVPDSKLSTSIRTLPLHFGRVLTGSHGGACEPDRDIPNLVRLVESGRLDLTAFPITEHGLSDINRAISALRSGAVGRQVIRMA